MLIAVAGLSGAGKTTTVEHLHSLGVGDVVYVGKYLHMEVRNRGLSATPENEHLVRTSLRDEFGPAALAKMAMKDLQDRDQPYTILLDAIYLRDEYDFYRNALGSNIIVIGIEASFELRAERLEIREDRPLNKDQLQQRDYFEKMTLGLEEVLNAANHRLVNEEGLEEFKLTLGALAARW